MSHASATTAHSATPPLQAEEGLQTVFADALDQRVALTEPLTLAGQAWLAMRATPPWVGAGGDGGDEVFTGLEIPCKGRKALKKARSLAESAHV